MKGLLRSYKAFLFLPLLFLFGNSGFAQLKNLEFKIQIHEADTTGEYSWGVYVRPDSGFVDGKNGTVTASGQVTILMNTGSSDGSGTQDSITNIESVSGNWNPDYDMVAEPLPVENRGIAYTFIGLDDEGSGILLEDNVETLLFTFQTNVDCPNRLELINNLTDPLNLPLLPGGSGQNVLGNNPGMDLAVFNTNTGAIFNWKGNYDPEAASCDDTCDMDGIPNGLEFVNGTDPCDACDPLGVGNFDATIDGGDILNVCAEKDSASLIVETTGGGAPFTYHLKGIPTNGDAEFVEIIESQESGDTFYVKPAVSAYYKLDSIVDALECSLDLTGLMDSVLVTVEGPLDWVGNGKMVMDQSSCTLDTLKFGVSASTGQEDGAGTILYQWMVSTDDGATFQNVINGTPYSNADTDTLVISNPDGLNGYQYFAKVFTETCDTLTSDIATLSVEGPFVVNASPTDITACGLDMIEFTADTENLGTGLIEKQWYYIDHNEATPTWTKIDDGINGDGVEYSGATTDSLAIQPGSGSDDISSLNGFWYRLQIDGTENGPCEQIFTDSAFLQVDGPLTIQPENMPKDTSSCVGEIACFGVQVDATASNLEYQWYISTDGAASWVALSNDNNYSGVRSDSMCILDVVGLDGALFRVDIQTEACSTISSFDPMDISTAASLDVNEAIAFDLDPQSEAICGGDSTLFIVNITSTDDLTKQWQMSADTGQTWVNVPTGNSIFSGADADTLIIDTRDVVTTQPDTLDGRLFRMNVSGDLCEEVLSREAELQVHHLTGDMIVLGPLDTTICAGEPAFFEVATNASFTGDTTILNYRWQILNPSTNQFVNLNPNRLYNGVTTNRLSITDVNGFNGMQFRAAVFTSECDTLFHPSETITLTVDGPYVFGEDNDAHPQDTIVCAGETAIFSSEPVLDLNTPDIFGDSIQYAGDSSALVYEWVYNDLGEYDNPQLVAEATWYKDSLGTGVDATTLSIPKVGAILDGYAFWLRVYSTDCGPELPIESLPAILNISGPLTINAHPADTDNCSDKGALFGAEVTNGGFGGQQLIEYSWQQIDTSDVWTPVVNDGNINGADTDTLSIDVLDGLNGMRYALIVSINGCGLDTTDLATLTEVRSASFTENPVDIITCAGADGFFAVTVDSTGNNNVEVLWQVSDDFGRNWSQVATDALYSFPTTDTLRVADVTGLNGHRYRAALATISCDTVFSLPARITAEGPVLFNMMDPTAEACQNVGLDIEATIDFDNTGPGVPQLHWQVSEDNGTTWDSLINEGIYDATTTNQLFISQVLEDTLLADRSGLDTILNINGYQYRLAATTKECAELEMPLYFYSDIVTVQTVSDTIGTCDFDLDGLINDDDDDDDNDGLSDETEKLISDGVTNDSLKVDQFNTDTNNNGITDGEEDADGDTINNGEETDDDNGDGESNDLDVFTGNPLDPCDPILSPACVGIVLDVKVKLQGAMIGVGKEQPMRDDLRAKSLIPATEPYGDMKVKRLGLETQEVAFVHVPDHSNGAFAGGQEEITDMNILSDHGENSVVDWVFVELRSGLQLDSVIATRSALLQRDGDIRDVIAPVDNPMSDTSRYDADGFSYLRFDSTLAGEYYVSVRHRNHLGVMTNQAGLLSPKRTVVDFIDPHTNALGTHPQRMVATLEQRDSLGTIMYTDSLEQYMWAGDLNSDRKVIFQGGQNDVNEMVANVINEQSIPSGGTFEDKLENFILAGYRRSDYNLDGNTIYQGPNNDRQMLIFNTILTFPDNQKLLANYVILEQLP